MNLQSLIAQRLSADLDPDHVLQLTVDQLNKDAGEVWVTFRPIRADEPSLQAIASEVKKGAHHLLHRDRWRLQQVLYRFDIAEAHTRLVLQEPDSEVRSSLLAQFLFDRALSKVLLRLTNV